MKHPSSIAIESFTYELPEDRIATYPLANRDGSKLLQYVNGKISETVFSQLPNLLHNNCHLVFNNTRVIQARLQFKNEKGRSIEVFCLEPAHNKEIAMTMAAKGQAAWNCLVGGLRYWKEEVLRLSEDYFHLDARISDRHENFVTINFNWQPQELSFAEILESFGNMPIPPYLNRESEQTDQERYQTVYAKQKGSVAAPTAGLHFTESVFSGLKQKGIKISEVTLHVGAGTFKPVKSSTMLGHEMHAEWIEVDAPTIRDIAGSVGKQIIAVGTTSLRTIESLYWMGVKCVANPGWSLHELEVKQWEPYDQSGVLPDTKTSLNALLSWMQNRGLEKLLCKTSILIAPPYELKVATGIITNFHQPQSTLLLLISAIIGDDWRQVYQYALTHDFRFLSYGDSCLLLK